MKGDSFCKGEAAQHQLPETKRWLNATVLGVYGKERTFLLLELSTGEVVPAFAWQDNVRKHGEGKLGPGPGGVGSDG